MTSGSERKPLPATPSLPVPAPARVLTTIPDTDVHGAAAACPALCPRARPVRNLRAGPGGGAAGPQPHCGSCHCDPRPSDLAFLSPAPCFLLEGSASPTPKGASAAQSPLFVPSCHKAGS